MLLLGHPKLGKTTLAGSLDQVTRKYYNKPSLFIALEQGEGGGTASIEDQGVDYVVPQSIPEFDRLVASLVTDKTYGGIVLDSSHEFVNRLVKPAALALPSREKIASRSMGVPERSDYQTMGEFTRARFNALINLTTNPALECRKHLIVTATVKEKYDGDALVSTGPDLPGALAGAALAMFQTIARIVARSKVLKTEGGTQRISERVLQTVAEERASLGDRYKVFPAEFVLTGPDGSTLGLPEIWEQYWIPKLKNKNNKENNG